VEVKCPVLHPHEHSFSDIIKRKNFYLNKKEELKRGHVVYKQIQKQIHVLNKTKGYLVVYFNEKARVFLIAKNNECIKRLLDKEKEEEKKKIQATDAAVADKMNGLSMAEKKVTESS